MGILRNKRLKKKIIRQRSPKPQYILPYFPITDDNLYQFRKFVQVPRDCVINAMQLVRIVDERAADIMRILVGDKGVTPDQIIQIFQYTFRKKYIFNLVEVPELLKMLENDLYFPRLTSIFVGIENNLDDGSINKHMIIIGKNIGGQSINIDPQNPTLCNLNLPECQNAVFGKNPKVFLIMEVVEPLPNMQVVPMEVVEPLAVPMDTSD